MLIKVQQQGLGACSKISQMKTWIPHHEDEALKVHVIYDACHMSKFMRNFLGDYKLICHEENDELHEIKWSYIEALNDVQRDLYIMWTKHKINISLAAQTLGQSVARAIDFCMM